MVRLKALLDANVLYPAGLRDLLLRLADRYLFAPLWSADIHAEWIDSLSADRPDIDRKMLDRTRAVMDRHFPDALVTGYEVLASELDLPDTTDRHVLAAAIHGRADVIVTANLRDFPVGSLALHAIVAQHPDTFVAHLIDVDPEAVLTAVRGHRAALRNPPRSVSENLFALERLGLHKSVSFVRTHESDI
ncbi:MAG: PIN domain-containing protein [Rhodobacteraceae bacterium]|nr:PIN domain-containing protein [Paracoccaceae bacterium]MCY4137530.1 PIN domain-containing protein [Paracoccaceae bacterium]